MRTPHLRRVAELLAGQAGNVAELACAVGLNNPSRFGKFFRKRRGHASSRHFGRTLAGEPAADLLLRRPAERGQKKHASIFCS